MKIKLFQARYNTARVALIALRADSEELEWKEIKDVDLRCLEDPTIYLNITMATGDFQYFALLTSSSSQYSATACSVYPHCVQAISGM
jgi:hypothetical protein